MRFEGTRIVLTEDECYLCDDWLAKKHPGKTWREVFGIGFLPRPAADGTTEYVSDETAPREGEADPTPRWALPKGEPPDCPVWAPGWFAWRRHKHDGTFSIAQSWGDMGSSLYSASSLYWKDAEEYETLMIPDTREHRLSSAEWR